ncbi:4-aminobutyrate transaminase, partial [Globisporangium splendens]
MENIIHDWMRVLPKMHSFSTNTNGSSPTRAQIRPRDYDSACDFTSHFASKAPRATNNNSNNQHERQQAAPRAWRRARVRYRDEEGQRVLDLDERRSEAARFHERRVRHEPWSQPPAGGSSCAATDRDARAWHACGAIGATHAGRAQLAGVCNVYSLRLVIYCVMHRGAESIENAVKLARHATGKQNIIVFQDIVPHWVWSLMGGVTVVPYPYAVHGPIYDEGIHFCNSTKLCSAWCLDQLRLALKQQTAPTDTAAVLVEPLMVQSGFGRTGEYFATNGHFDVVPDILVVAKGIANGFPLSVVASRKDLTDLQVPGAMGGTYAGNPVSCAAAIATQDVIRDELVLENTKARSRQFFAGLERFKASGKYPILDVRGLGLMVAIEFDAKAVPVGTAARISQSCLAHGMMVLTTSIFETLRFMPPLTVSAEECNLGLEIFEKALQDVFQQSVLDHEQ